MVSSQRGLICVALAVCVVIGAKRTLANSSTSAEIGDEFKTNGVVGPFAFDKDWLLKKAFPSIQEAWNNAHFSPLFDAWDHYYRSQAELPWAKSSFLSLPDIYSLATRPEIVAKVEELIGPAVLLWGTDLLTREAGSVHAWHTEVEHAWCERSASVWLGVRGVSRGTALQVVTHSHRTKTQLIGPDIGYGVPCQSVDEQQQAACREEVRAKFDAQGEALALQVHEQLKVESAVKTFEMGDGDFVIFHGQAFHGTVNPTSNPRTAMIFQYASADCAIRRPLANFTIPPSDVLPAYMPPVRVIAGRITPPQAAINNIVSDGGPTAPVMEPHLARSHYAPAPPASALAVSPWASAPVPERVTPWEWHKLPGVRFHYENFRLATPVLEEAWSASSVHDFAVPPHGLHTHPQVDEVVYLVNGTAAVIRQGPYSQLHNSWQAAAGSLWYHPGGEAHSVVCQSPEGCGLVAMKWRARQRPMVQCDSAEDFQGVPQNMSAEGDAVLPGILLTPQDVGGRYTLLASRPTAGGLRRLHIHIDEYDPQQELEAHADPYDVLIIVEAGRVRTMPGEAVAQAGDVIFKPMGIVMSLEAGTAGCRLLVLEFHASEPAPNPVASNSTSRGGLQRDMKLRKKERARIAFRARKKRLTEGTDLTVQS